MSEAPARLPIPASDQTWLHMDRPNNLMHVHSMMWLEREPVWPDVVGLLEERLLARFPVFQRRAAEIDGHWMWEDDPHFDLDRHVRRGQLPGAGDIEALQAHAAARFAESFDPTHPLWDIEMFTDVTGLDDEPRTVFFFRFHHALADGIRLVQLLLSLCDSHDDEAMPPAVGRGQGGLLAGGADLVRRGAVDALDVVKGVGASALRLPRMVTSLRPSSLEQGLELLIHPGRLIDAVSGLSSEANQSMNTITEVTRMLAAGRSIETSWSGIPGVQKRVSWVTGLDLGAVKALGRTHGGTVNDVLLSVVSRALTRYLREKDSLVDEIHWLVPVSLLPMDRNLPEELGNHFSLVFLPMPLGIEDPAQLIAAVRSRMNRLKLSAEPVITFGIQWVLAESPKVVAVALTDLFANKGVGVLTNVPGPRSPMTFAGVPVSGVLGWAPTSGDQPLSLAIFSYNGTVSIGIAADAQLVPDPGEIAAMLEDEFAAMAAGA